MKLGKNSRPTEERSTKKLKAEKAENKAKLTPGLIVFRSLKKQLKRKSKTQSDKRLQLYIG